MLSFRKFFGSYLHALIPHAGLQIRIVSGMTAFAESEKRLFQQAKLQNEHQIINLEKLQVILSSEAKLKKN